MSVALRIRQEEPADREAIHALHCAAFGQSAEADLVDRLRENGDLVLSLVAVDEIVVGHVAFSPLANDAGLKASALAPLAVLPSHQRNGVGSALAKEGLRLLAEEGHGLVIVLGEPAYYERFGFKPETASRFLTPYDGPYLQGLMLSTIDPLRPATLHYARAFAGLA
ncbi:GNAT family N-acetyltransferase [Microvirga flavescens]|uniref:GNAT family N-acetyltransferase n=1 Tax=Microvirga flavescens TaxID=2249811 RepID=UPI000DD5AA52|nr:N-acetyltransferase [Microvirga flavescens]